ncbi:MAG: DNA primase [Oscillochloridaceae bacterium umkhey_bin13]
MSQIDEIRNKIDLVELIGSLGVNLRKTGRSYVGFCPFHPNSRTPAFTVYPDTQSFYCFGCHAAGTAFDFVMRKQGLDFRQALEELATRAGVRLTPRGEEERQEDAQRAKLLEINSLAAKVFNHLLIATPRGEPGRAYVEQRAINPTMVETFQLGYSPDEWGFLFSYLTEKKGYDPEDVVAAGLAIHHESGRYYDRFRGRLIFPIRNAKGEVVGFGGRALGDGQPKYLNSPETLLYKKGELLYGLDLAREAIRLEDRTVVVEGYVDVISAHQHGFRNVVAPLGTALTRSHVNLLKRLSHNVYLALDADAAGQRATLKGLNALRENAESEGHLVTTAQGAVRLEGDVAMRIIRMPEGRDPDEVIRADPTHWQQLVTEAVPVMEFYLTTYTAGRDLSRPEEQRAALDQLLPLLHELDGAQQRVYVARIEQVVGIRAELILDLLKGNPGRSPAQRPGKPGRPGSPSRPAFQVPARANQPQPAPDEPPHPAEQADAQAANRPRPRPSLPRSGERFLLALALRHPTVEAAIEALLEAGLAEHPGMRDMLGGGIEDLFEEPTSQAIWQQFTLLPLDWRPNTPEELQQWAEGLDELLRDEAIVLINGHGIPTLDDFRYRQEAEHSARHLRTEQARRLKRRLLQRLSEADEEVHAATMAQLATVTAFLAASTTPQRSSTFPDLRDLLGRG